MKALLLAAAVMIAGCKTSFSEEKASDFAGQVKSDGELQKNETRTVVTGPETDLTLNFALPEVPETSATGSAKISLLQTRKDRQIHLTGKPSDLAAILDSLPLDRLTGATLAQKGPASDTSASQSVGKHEKTADLSGHATDDRSKKSGPAGLFGGLLAMWPFLLAAGVAALAIWRKDLLVGLVKKFLP